MGSLHSILRDETMGREIMKALQARLADADDGVPNSLFARAAHLALEFTRCDQIIFGHPSPAGAGYVVHRVPQGPCDEVALGPHDTSRNVFGSLLIREMTLQVERGLGFNEPFARDLIRQGFMSAITVPVATPHEPWGFLGACSNSARAFDHGERQILRAVSAFVGTATAGPSPRIPEADTLASHQVRRAKREWETTVDSLTEVIVLLDSEGYVVRANRALEDWGLGDVAGIVGNRIGSLLAASREYGSSPLRRPWPDIARLLLEQSSMEWEQECAWIGKTLRFRLRMITRNDDETFQPGEGYAVLVIEDITRRKQLEREILEKNRQLEAQVARRTYELVSRNAQLRQEIRAHLRDKRALSRSERELHVLSRQLLCAQETERKRIASELHDSIGQALSAIKFKVECFLGASGQSDEVQDGLQPVVARIRETIDEVRKIAMALRPSILDDLGVISTIDWFNREFHNTYPHVEMRVRVDAVESDIPEHLKLVIYRIIQEAFNNIAKHSGGSCLSLALGAGPAGLQLSIFDDGVGFEWPGGACQESERVGLGLKSMRERVELTRGRFCVESAPGFGTGIHIAWSRAACESAGA